MADFMNEPNVFECCGARWDANKLICCPRCSKPPKYQALFDHMADTYGVWAFQEELEEIIKAVDECRTGIPAPGSGHHPDCDVYDLNPEGIRKPCNCKVRRAITLLEKIHEENLIPAWAHDAVNSCPLCVLIADLKKPG